MIHNQDPNLTDGTYFRYFNVIAVSYVLLVHATNNQPVHAL